MTKPICTVLGALLLLAGLLGFAAPGLMGMHLSTFHNAIHLASGALALYFGLRANAAKARTFCTLFGAIYGLLGLAGFIAGGSSGTWTVIPHQLVLGTMDHLVHVILGSVFLVAGLYRKPLHTHTHAH